MLELLIEVADDDPRFFRRQLASTTQAMLQIAGAAQLEASTRR